MDAAKHKKNSNIVAQWQTRSILFWWWIEKVKSVFFSLSPFTLIEHWLGKFVVRSCHFDMNFFFIFVHFSAFFLQFVQIENYYSTIDQISINPAFFLLLISFLYLFESHRIINWNSIVRNNNIQEIFIIWLLFLLLKRAFDRPPAM